MIEQLTRLLWLNFGAGDLILQLTRLRGLRSEVGDVEQQLMGAEDVDLQLTGLRRRVELWDDHVNKQLMMLRWLVSADLCGVV